MTFVESEYKNGTCEWCGNGGIVFADNSRCEQCDGDIYRCSVCKEDQHVDDLCRHIFRDSNFEWAGSGVGAPGDGVKQSFFKLLDLMPTGLAVDLRKAIRSCRFHTWLIAPLIGGGGMLELHGMPYQDGRKWGDAMIELGEGENAEEPADGYHWLASLYDKKTREANRTTIAWINEWNANQGVVGRARKSIKRAKHNG